MYPYHNHKLYMLKSTRTIQHGDRYKDTVLFLLAYYGYLREAELSVPSQ